MKSLSSFVRIMGGRSLFTLSVPALLIGSGCQQAPGPESVTSVRSITWGQMPDGGPVHLYTLKNRHGLSVKISTLGATITELRVPDRAGAFTNVVLGSDKFEQYQRGFPAAGATIGRFANRIAGARFTLDGREVKVTANSGTNHIHGGRRGFASVVWRPEVSGVNRDGPVLTLSYLSRDGEEGYPGNLKVTVTFTLTDDNELRIDYVAVTDATTVVNLTNHSYFNLAGSGDVLGHVLWMAARRYTPADTQLIPTGEIASVAGTPLDFTTPTPIGERIEQLKPRVNGYDHNFVLDSGGGSLALVARLVEPQSGRVMEVRTTQPGMQIYTGNHLNGKVAGVGGVVYPRHGGVCFETQHFPDSPNRPPFPSTVLRPGETFRSTTVFAFATSRSQAI